MAERVSPFGIGFLVDGPGWPCDDRSNAEAVHADVASAVACAGALADRHPGRRFDVYLAVEVARAEPQAGWVTPAPAPADLRVVGLERVTLGAFNILVVDVDGRGPGREPPTLHDALDRAIRRAHFEADRRPGRRFGVYVRAKSVRRQPAFVPPAAQAGARPEPRP